MNWITQHTATRCRRTAWLAQSVLMLAGLLAGLCCGCNSRAHSEVYRQRMANEIRVLEDQLYDADYQNRVLQGKLHRYQQQIESARIPTPGSHDLPLRPNSTPPAAMRPDRPKVPSGATLSPDQPNLTDPRQQPPSETTQDAVPLTDAIDGDSDFDLDSFNSDLFDTGQPISPDQLPSPIETSPTESKPERRPTIPTPDPAPEPIPPPPGIAPPGPKDLDFDPIIPGDIDPPSLDGSDDKPPGQILLPDSALSPDNIPESLRIHTGLSAGIHQDGVLSGATVIVQALDRRSRNVDLNQFEVAAELAVVMLDPEMDPDQAKIKRWDFGRDEVQAMIERHRDGTLEIPLTWDEKQPRSDRVIVHVRLRGDDQEMTAEATLDLQPKTASSTWSPRAE